MNAIIDLNAALDHFRAAMQAAGYSPPDDLDTDGKLRRFSVSGKPDIANIADLAGASVEGQALAGRLLDGLGRACSTGDEIERAVRDILGPIDAVRGAKLGGFLRVCQKVLERAAVLA